MGGGLNINHFYFLGYGALWTVGLSAMAIIGGGLAGFILALMRVSPSRPVRLISSIYIQILQGTPLLVVLFLGYFGLAAIGFDVSAFAAAAVSLTIYNAAYFGEIWRGCIQSVPKAQWEAAEGLGLGRTQRMFKVILPQAIRIATPTTVGYLVHIVKDTSLASVIGFVELARAGQIINNSLFEPFLVYVIIAGIYFALCYPLSVFSRRLERRLATGRPQFNAV
jgi:polar amino acid transport system permease protein